MLKIKALETVIDGVDTTVYIIVTYGWFLLTPVRRICRTVRCLLDRCELISPPWVIMVRTRHRPSLTNPLPPRNSGTVLTGSVSFWKLDIVQRTFAQDQSLFLTYLPEDI